MGARLPLARTWYGWDIRGLRDTGATYGPIPLDTLPVLAIADDVAWLAPVDREVLVQSDKRRLPGSEPSLPFFEKNEREPDGGPSFLHHELAALRSQAAREGIELPKAFIELFSSNKLMNRVFDPTGCYFDFPEGGITRDPLGLGGRILRFQNDQQCCIMWYLFFPKDGPASVLASCETRFGMYLEEHDPDDPAAIAAARAVTSVVADSFAEYMYRFWIEGRVYFKQQYELPMDPAEASYARQLSAASKG